MSNSFNKEERVAFEQLLEGFHDALVLSRVVKTYRTDQTMMARTNDVIWRPVPYILPAYDGMDQSSNFGDKTQLSVPAAIGFKKSVPWQMDAIELRDALQENRLLEAAKQQLSSQINIAVNNTAANGGTLVVKRTVAASGFDDAAQAEAIMNETGVAMDRRALVLSTRDYNGMASNLQTASRSFGNQKSDSAYERAFVGRVASFDTFKQDYSVRLTAAAGVGVTVNGANQRYVPRATSTAGSGETNNVDNRYQNLNITVTSGTVKVGDCFMIAGSNNVHQITKQDTGQPKTFRITAIVSGGGGSGVVQISPPIISADSSPTQAEVQYKNCTATPANGAAIVWLNTVSAYVNPFFHQDAIEILPGRYAVPTDAGAAVMRGTTEQGFELVFQKQYNIDKMLTKYRVDTLFGTVLLNPEAAGVMLFSQT